MGKALIGTTVTPSQLRLLDEIRALRQRVAELEAALERASQAEQDRLEVVAIDEVSATVGA